MVERDVANVHTRVRFSLTAPISGALLMKILIEKVQLTEEQKRAHPLFEESDLEVVSEKQELADIALLASFFND